MIVDARLRANSLDDYLRRFDESVAYVETLYRGSGGNSSVATHCGFKVMISQLPDDLPDLKRWIRHIRRHYDAKVLFLVRENHLERHISGRMSMATGFSHLDTVCSCDMNVPTIELRRLCGFHRHVVVSWFHVLAATIIYSYFWLAGCA